MRHGISIAALVALAACQKSEPPAAENSSVEPAAAEQEMPPTNEADASNATAEAEPSSVPKPSTAAHPCLVQDGKPVAAGLKGVGTEPFWAAEIEGRCVTYKTPENQAGTRIWTRFSGSFESGQWSGSLGKERFVLLTRPEANCSDGMSDRRYPIAVTLTIGKEERRGCAFQEGEGAGGA